MFEDFTKILNDIKSISDPDKLAAAKTAFITYCIAKVVYYIVAGAVTWVLGRRIIQATFAALREAKRGA